MKNVLRLVRPALLATLILAAALAAPAQQPPAQQPPAIVLAHIAAATPPDEAVAPLIYLASDQLKGRYIGRPEIDTAALYIADQFREAGARPVPGATGYFQFFTHHFPANSRDSGSAPKDIRLRNVLAFIPGLDPQLHQQYIVLSSHYDHLGVTLRPQMEEGKLDSIYNGARDNASGTTAVIDAARYFGKHPAKRSILFICYTAEEEGLIGSEWYANHPLIALNKTVYNLNIDNASYDDTTLITLVGLHRTSEDSAILAAAAAYGLTVNNDPTGGSLFFESDNAPLALHGVPAPTYSMGMRAMDSTIFNRYHRLSDETGNMDMHYVVKWIRAYILAARTIADQLDQPRWTPGDLYEKAWQKLYQP
jgi:Zn-dependent M28 family amino/carboxypeptidase